MPSRPDVMGAFEVAAQDGTDRPMNMTDLTMRILTAHGLPWDPFRACPVRRNDLFAVLNGLTADGLVMAKRGREWREMGISFLHMRETGWYWGRPSDVARWLAAVTQKRADAELAGWEANALLVLRDRHRDEYDQIVVELAGAKFTRKGESRGEVVAHG